RSRGRPVCDPCDQGIRQPDGGRHGQEQLRLDQFQLHQYRTPLSFDDIHARIDPQMRRGGEHKLAELAEGRRWCEWLPCSAEITLHPEVAWLRPLADGMTERAIQAYERALALRLDLRDEGMEQTADGVELHPFRLIQSLPGRQQMGSIRCRRDTWLEHTAIDPPLTEQRITIRTVARLEPMRRRQGHTCGDEVAQV